MVTIVVATGRRGEIGKDNQLLWRLPRDMQHFKQLTMDHPIIMGRKTYESIGRALPGRTNIVVSRSENYFLEGALVVGSLKEALKFAQKIDPEVFVLGGGAIYEQTLEKADAIERTLVEGEFEADTYFPSLDEKQWKLVREDRVEADEKNPYALCFQRFERREKQESH